MTPAAVHETWLKLLWHTHRDAQKYWPLLKTAMYSRPLQTTWKMPEQVYVQARHS